MQINVAVVTPEGLDGRGGIGRVMTYLARQLASDAPDIRVVVQRTRYSERPYLKHLSVPFALAGFLRRCLSGSIDVAHINVAPRGSTWRKRLFLLAAGWTGKPVVLHLHGSGYDEFYNDLPENGKAKIRSMFQAADAVVALSDYWERFIRSVLQVPIERIVKIPNGVPAADVLVRKATDDPTILFLGLVGKRKGVDVLLEALATLAAEGLKPSVLIGGNGEVDLFSERARSLGLADQVTFLGWIGEDQVDLLLRQADLFILPSRAENQPVSILEAMARGLPVIASNVGAIPEQVVDGVTGRLVKAGDAKGLADAIRAMAASAETRERFGSAGRERFEEHFSIVACAARFAAMYRLLGSAKMTVHE